MLVFEEPETHSLWLAKALPRDWLAPGEAPLVVESATTRYGRVSFSMVVGAGRDYSVAVNVTLPALFATSGPTGGLQVRVRAPLAHAGKLSGVSVGGKPWSGFNASTETIAFTPAELTTALLSSGLPSIVAVFSAGGV